MKKILFVLSIAAALLAGVSCKKDKADAPPEYAALFGLWSETVIDDMEIHYILSISEDKFIEKRIVASSLELDELFYNDMDIYYIESFEKTTSDKVDGDVWKITLKGGGDIFIFKLGDGKARMNWWEIHDEFGYYWLDAVKTGVKMTYRYVPASAMDLGLSVYWGLFDMHRTPHDPNFDPNEDVFQNDYYKDGEWTYYPGDFYKYPSDGDIVNKTYSGKWRMPTSEEWTELFDNCTFEACKDGIKNTYNCYLARSKKPGFETESVQFLRNGYFDSDNTWQNGDEAWYWTTNQAGGIGHFMANMQNLGQQGVAMPDNFACLIHPVWDPNM